MQEKTPYDVLGLSIEADEEEIKKAYRNLAKKYHPDSNAGDKAAEKRFQEISDAYQILQDKDKKRKLDEQIKQQKNNSQQIKTKPKTKTSQKTAAMKQTNVDLKNTNKQFADFFGFAPTRKK